jgi:hypothetical protein
MAGEQSGSAPATAHGNRWLTAAASLAVGVAFFALWFWLLPRWLGFRVETAGAARWRWLAAVPSVLGFAVAMRCVWDFGWTGRGTPAPRSSAEAIGGGGILPLRAEPHVRGLRSGVGWAVGCVRARQPDSDCCRRGRCPRRASVRGLL